MTKIHAIFQIPDIARIGMYEKKKTEDRYLYIHAKQASDQ